MLSIEESAMAEEEATTTTTTTKAEGQTPDTVTKDEAVVQTTGEEPAWQVYQAGRRAVAEGQFEEAVDIFSSVLESLYDDAKRKRSFIY